MTRAGSLPKRCPAKYQRLVMISGDYHVKYCVRNSLDKTKCIYSIQYMLKRASHPPSQNANERTWRRCSQSLRFWSRGRKPVYQTCLNLCDNEKVCGIGDEISRYQHFNRIQWYKCVLLRFRTRNGKMWCFKSCRQCLLKFQYNF